MSPRHWIKSFLFLPLRIAAVRNRVLFWARQEHYAEVEIEVPLSHGFACPIYSPEYWCSFSEIFVNGEYEPVFERIALPDRWLDIGCHAGFFSLYMAWRRVREGAAGPFECLLIDADARVEGSIERIQARNKLPSFTFAGGAIGSGTGAIHFTERGFMASSSETCDPAAGIRRSVPVLLAKEILGLLPPPYDLIKIDVEGSEFDFLSHYGELIRNCRHLLLEWHSWHPGGGGVNQLRDLAKERGLRMVEEVQPAHEVSACRHCGVLLFENPSAAKGGGSRAESVALK